MFAYRLTSTEPPGYRIKFDGIEVSRVSKRRDHFSGREYWHWGVDIMPLMDHGGRPPSGDAETFETGLAAFRGAFQEWLSRIPVEVWELNRDHIRAGDRWRK
jgi:hypothetical protein